MSHLELLGFRIIKRELMRLIDPKHVFCLLMYSELLKNNQVKKKTTIINSKEAVLHMSTCIHSRILKDLKNVFLVVKNMITALSLIK